MINIRVGKPIKLSGLHSVQVSFPYNEELVNLIKQYSPAIWHKRLGLWEVPIYHLSSLLDDFCKISEITMTIDEERNSGDFGLTPLTDEEIAKFKVRPFQHQVEAINYGLSKGKFLLLDGMGIGKSLEMMYLAETLHNRGLLDHCLIICGVDSLRTNWKSEIRKFSNLSAVVLGEYITRTGKTRYKTIKERCEQLINPIDEFFIIVNAATIGFDQFVEAFKKTKNKIGMIALDEAHRFATKSSNRGSNLLKLDAERKIAATGTLITNSPISCYVPLAWTENDQATLTNYKSQYCKFGGFSGYEIVGYQNLDLLQEEITACSLRRTFDQVRGDMPKKTIEYEYVEMSDEQEKFYEAIKDGVKEEADKVDLHPGNLLALTTRLRQATSAPSVLTSNPVESCKVERAVQIAEDLLESGEKVVIFSTFIEPTEVLKTKLTKFHPLLATGNVSDDLAQANIDQFRTSADHNLLICTTAKAGTGYSFPECHYSIFIDTPWTDALFSQCCDRIYRITSQQPVFIKVLVAKDTIDERVQHIVEMKKDLQDYLVDGKMSDGLANEMRSILREL